MIDRKSEEMMESIRERDRREVESVRVQFERMGYGRVMQIANQLWKERHPIGAHSIGPCEVFMVSCDCENSECDLCCGSGKITKGVKQLRSDLEAARKDSCCDMYCEKRYTIEECEKDTAEEYKNRGASDG